MTAAARESPHEGGPRLRADESVARRFTRVMNATTSRWGVLTDPPLVAIAAGIGLIALLAAIRLGASQAVVYAVAAVAALPIAVALGVVLGLAGARRRVVDWLAGVPFAVENMNAVLNGVGELLEIRFAEGVPTSQELNAELDRVHPDAFVTNVTEESRSVEVRIGVVDSKRNPSRSNHLRYERVRRLVDDVLVPLSRKRPIVDVRVK